MEKPTRSSPERSHGNPWWIPRLLLGRVPPIEPPKLALLGAVALGLLFENYDYSLLNAALKHIARDLNLPETELSSFVAWIRLGGLPAFLIVPLSDQLGRRRVFLASVLGLSLGTFATAFSETALVFIACQVVTRTCMLTCATVAVVIITEEYPAAHRGWGIGMLSAVAAVGHGLGAGLFAAVELLPHGWRSLYQIGLLPVLLLPWLARNIPETARFTALQARAGTSLVWGVQSWLRPLAALFREYPARTLGISLLGSLTSVGHAVVFAFIGWFVLTEHAWEPWQYSLMVIGCGALGIPGNVIAGRLADRFGRRKVGAVVLGVFPLVAFAFFRGPPLTLPVSWVLVVFFAMAGNVIVRAFSTELFPTAQRGSAAGLLSVMETLGGGIGLLVLSGFTREPGQLAFLIPLASGATLIAAVVALGFPETSQRELEEIR